MTKTDNIIFILFIFTLLILSVVFYDRVITFEAETRQAQTLLVEISREHTKWIVAERGKALIILGLLKVENPGSTDNADYTANNQALGLSAQDKNSPAKSH